MKFLLTLITLASLVSCGKENSSTCISREAKILQCQALKAAERYYSTARQLEIDLELCKKEFPVNKCY